MGINLKNIKKSLKKKLKLTLKSIPKKLNFFCILNYLFRKLQLICKPKCLGNKNPSPKPNKSFFLGRYVWNQLILGNIFFTFHFGYFTENFFSQKIKYFKSLVNRGFAFCLTGHGRFHLQWSTNLPKVSASSCNSSLRVYGRTWCISGWMSLWRGQERRPVYRP